jgi:hypothetical protein
MTRLAPLLAPLLTVALLACRADPDGAKDVDYEGDAAGECTDGADNDRDGYFDCADNGCWQSPDCAEADTDTDSDSDADADADADADSDTDTDTDTDVDTPADRFTAYTVAYTLEWDFDDAYADLLAFYGLGDCTSTYAGAGSQVGASGSSVTFAGDWAMTGSDCAVDLQDAVWWDDPGGASYATLTFSSDLSHLDAWIQHRDADDTAPLPSPADNGQWTITAMGAAVSGGAANHTEDETTTIEGIIPLTLVHSASFTLAE